MFMLENLLKKLDEALSTRRLASGGYCEYTGGNYRPDSTAWAVLALCTLGDNDPAVSSARDCLQQDQHADGRISISRNHPDVIWPTSLALLAWLGSPFHDEARSLAARFLLSTSGIHAVKQPVSTLGHDSSLRGWPWVEQTHSWIEPTALTIIALRRSGFESHPRIQEGVEMVINRQLPSGGWNYGNTLVFGQELQPMPDSTGLALEALANMCGREEVAASLTYLEMLLPNLRTPFSLSWSLLGLAAWGITPGGRVNLVHQCLKRQSLFGVYPTSSLSLLTLALQAPSGLFKHLQGRLS